MFSNICRSLIYLVCFMAIFITITGCSDNQSTVTQIPTTLLPTNQPTATQVPNTPSPINQSIILATPTKLDNNLDSAISPTKPLTLAVQIATQPKLAHIGYSVTKVALSDDNKLLATLGLSLDSGGLNIIIWEIATGKAIKAFDINPIVARKLIFNANNLITAVTDTKEYTWQISDGKLIAEKPTTAQPTTQPELAGDTNADSTSLFEKVETTLAVSNDAKLSLVALLQERDFWMELRDLEKNTVLDTLKPFHTYDPNNIPYFKQGYTAATFSVDKNLLVTLTSRGIVDLWDVPSRKIISSFFVVPDTITSSSLSVDGKLLATASYNTVNYWNTQTGQLTQSLPISPEATIYFGQKNTQLAQIWEDSVSIHDIEAQKVLTTFVEPLLSVSSPHQTKLARGVFDSQALILTLYTTDYMILRYNLVTGQRDVLKYNPDYYLPEKFSPDRKLFIASRKGKEDEIDYTIFNVEGNIKQTTFPGIRWIPEYIGNKFILVKPTKKENYQLFDVAQPSQPVLKGEFSETVPYVFMTAGDSDGTWLAGTSYDNKSDYLVVGNIATKQTIKILLGSYKVPPGLKDYSDIGIYELSVQFLDMHAIDEIIFLPSTSEKSFITIYYNGAFKLWKIINE